MKKYFLIPLTVFAMGVSSVHAEPAEARLMYNDQSHDDVIVLAYRNGVLTFKRTPQDLNRVQVRAPRLEAIFFKQPDIFKQAMALYNARKYEEAKQKFAECERLYKSMDSAPNNYAKLGGFYKMECSRRMFDLAALGVEMENYLKEGLTRKNQLDQLEVNVFWEAVRLREWERLDRLAQAWRKRKVTGSQRAQIAYCHGLALEQLAKKNPELISKALNAFNMAMTADFSHSMEIVTAAADRALAVYDSDPEVGLAIKLWGTEDEDMNSGGRQRLLEAHAMVKLYELGGFDKFKKLNTRYKKFLKYAPSDEEEL